VTLTLSSTASDITSRLMRLAPRRCADILLRRGLTRRPWTTLGRPPRPMTHASATTQWRGESEDELRQLLTSHGVDVSAWARGNAKTVASLFTEVQEKETTLLVSGGTVTRQLTVMQVAVRDPRHKDRVLVEASQVLPDGRERRREVLLAEKMIDGEDWQDAALRGIAEELGSVLGDALHVRLRTESHAVRTAAHDSPSYPGIRTEYTIHRVDADVEGLPVDVDGFETREPRPGGKELLTRWEWRMDIPPDKWFGYT